MNPKQKARRGLSHLEDAILDTLFQADAEYMRAVDIPHKIGSLPSYDYGTSSRIVRHILEKLCCDRRVEPRKSKNGKNIAWKLTSSERKKYADISSRQNIDDIIDEIKSRSTDGDYIYRGEPKKYPKLSSALYREYFDDTDVKIDFASFDLRNVQREMLRVAKKHIGEPPQGLFENLVVGQSKRRYIEQSEQRSIIDSDELEILTELQHYGGITNLIDFTTDFLIAIFFACVSHPTKDGRVILLRKSERMEDERLIRPQNPRHRVIAQKSVFLYPPDGFIDVSENDIVYIPSKLKIEMRKYLRKHHNISSETIYNDLHGVIRNQKVHYTANKEFYFGVTFQYRGNNAEKNSSSRREKYQKAITHYERAIEQDSGYSEAYYHIGVCRLHLEDWDKAFKALMVANDMGFDIRRVFHNHYPGGIAELQEKTGIEIPYQFKTLLGSL